MKFPTINPSIGQESIRALSLSGHQKMNSPEHYRNFSPGLTSLTVILNLSFNFSSLDAKAFL